MGLPDFNDGKIKVVRCTFCNLSQTGRELKDFNMWSFAVFGLKDVVWCPACFQSQVKELFSSIYEE